MLAVVTVEQGLRVAIGSAKPVVTEHTPPAALSWVLLPIVAVALAGSLTTGRAGTLTSPARVRVRRAEVPK